MKVIINKNNIHQFEQVVFKPGKVILVGKDTGVCLTGFDEDQSNWLKDEIVKNDVIDLSHIPSEDELYEVDEVDGVEEGGEHDMLKIIEELDKMIEENEKIIQKLN